MQRVFKRVTPTTRRGVERCRTFFNPTKFLSASPLPHAVPETQSYHERKILPYGRSELYRVIVGIESYSNFVPYCTGSRILHSEVVQGGVTMMEAELTVGFLAFKENYTSTVTCKPHEFVEAVASSSSPLFKSLTTVWHLNPVPSSVPQLLTSVPQEPEVSARNSASGASPDQGPTLVTLDLSFAFANPMHAAVSVAFFGQVSKLMVKAFEQRCVTLYGTRTG